MISCIAGIYSRKAFERLGFSVQAEYMYADYDYEGAHLLSKITGNHRCITLLTKPLLPKQDSIDEEAITLEELTTTTTTTTTDKETEGVINEKRQKGEEKEEDK